MTTYGTAKWQGGLKDGKGAITTKSGALSDYPYGFASRFEGKPGTNPEELIGAAHSGCFTMALSLITWSRPGFKADEMNTKAEITLTKQGDGFAITKSQLTLRAKIPGIDSAKFQELAGMAEKGCPVSKVLNCEISLDAALDANAEVERRSSAAARRAPSLPGRAATAAAPRVHPPRVARKKVVFVPHQRARSKRSLPSC